RNVLWLAVVAFAILLPLRRQTQWHATLNLPVGQTAFSDVATFRKFQWMAQRTEPMEPFFNDSALCLYLALDNPTGAEFVTYDEFTRPDQVVAIVQTLQRHPPHFVMLLPEKNIRLKNRDHASLFRKFVHKDYRLSQVFSLSQGDFEQIGRAHV